MKLGILFSGGKDSMYAAWLAKKEGNELTCLITVYSANQDSFMFHTPAIEMCERQAEIMEIPLLKHGTKGEKEKELEDLENAVKLAIKEYKIQGIVTGALASDYQASRIRGICKKLGLECINPLWHRNQIEFLRELVENGFEVIISGVAAYPLNESWIGRKIDAKFIEETKKLQEKFGINPAGEGGEFESLVINCPLFKKKLNFKIVDVIGENNSWRAIIH